MKEWIKIFDNKSDAENVVNNAFEEGYELIDFKMKMAYGSYSGEYIREPSFSIRYFVHMRKNIK